MDSVGRREEIEPSFSSKTTQRLQTRVVRTAGTEVDEGAEIVTTVSPPHDIGLLVALVVVQAEFGFFPMDAVPAAGETGHLPVGLGQIGAPGDFEVEATVVHAVSVTVLENGVVGRTDALPGGIVLNHSLPGDRVMELVGQLSACSFDEKVIDEQFSPRTHCVEWLGAMCFRA